MTRRIASALRAAVLIGGAVTLSACVADPYGYEPAGYGYGYGAPAIVHGGYGYAGGYHRPAPFFSAAAFRPQPPLPFQRPYFGGFGNGYRPAPVAVAPAPRPHFGGFGGWGPRAGGVVPAPRFAGAPNGGGWHHRQHWR